jgi:murein DD-endopeptidase MepM/ murein hydrolase activator NlpD
MHLDKHTTLMIIPETDKQVRTFRIPNIFVRSFVFLIVVCSIVLGILIYDYWKILGQIYETKYLTQENKQLKEQIQLFQMKVNSLSQDLERIHIFEQKLRIITGLDKEDTSRPLVDMPEAQQTPDQSLAPKHKLRDRFQIKLDDATIVETLEYQNLKNLYEKKIATTLGREQNYEINKKLSKYISKHLELASSFAKFDFKYNNVNALIKNVELNIHELDQFLLDRDSILKSTPTLMPTNGWITSYYGPRMSPYAGMVKMHEGLDVGAPYGAKIVAPADGMVTFSGQKAGFGKFVQIDHGYGIETIYGHSQKLFVEKGQRVKRGALIAHVGSTGASTGPHLHYEIRVNGIAVDPLYFILNKEI